MTTATRWSRGELLARCAFASVGLLLPLLLLELVLAIRGYDGLDGLRNGRERILRRSAEPWLEYELVPGSTTEVWNVRYDINPDGYRGPRSQRGVFEGLRVVALGDSITFGTFLPVEATYPSLLEDRLNEDLGDGKPGVDVINFGVGGYDTVQEVALLEQRGLSYRPDVVILGFCLNDLAVVSQNLELLERSEGFQESPLYALRSARALANRLDRRRIGSWLVEKNRPENFLAQYGEVIASIGEDEFELRSLMQRAGAGELPSAWYDSELRVGRLRFAFEGLAQLAAANGFDVVVLVFPWLAMTENGYPHATSHEIVAWEARRVGFQVLDLTERYVAAGIENLQRSPTDLVHPNARGHEIAAEVLALHLHAEYLARGP